MQLPLPELLSLAVQCAPAIAPQTMAAIVAVESRSNILAIGVNGAPKVSLAPRTRAEAVQRAGELIAKGRSVDLGLAQINSANLRWLGLSLQDAFEPCRNLAAGARVLQDGYGRALRTTTSPQAALRTALSFYNTGHPTRGRANGYVAKVEKAARQLRLTPEAETPTLAQDLVAAPASEAPAAERPWDVFQTRRVERFAGAPAMALEPAQ